MLGLRDYVNKTGFPSVVIGLSGGVDSALTAAVAADALGPERVHTLMMPSPYTSRDSRWRTPRPAPRRSACRYDIVGIEPAMEAFRDDARCRCSATARTTSPRRTSRAAPAASR